MLHPSRQPVKADDAQLACAAQQGAALVRRTGTQARTTFAAPGSSGRRKAMPQSVKLLSFGLLAVVAVAAGDLIAAGRATAAPQELTLTSMPQPTRSLIPVLAETAPVTFLPLQTRSSTRRT
jgi:hypothetical protein